MKPKHKTAKFSHFQSGISIAAIFVTLASSSSNLTAADWLGTISSDWNDDSNWSGGAGTGGQFATINTSTPNIATISTDVTAAPIDINIGAGAGFSGILNHPSGVGITGVGNWMIVAKFGGTGTYNLANTNVIGSGLSGFAEGSGRMNVSGRFLVGEGPDANGTVNINTSDGLYIGSQMVVGLGSPSVMNLENGTVAIGNEAVIFGSGSMGTLNMSGGSITKAGSDNFIFGAAAGAGIGNISGGSIASNNVFEVGEGAGSSGTLNFSGGEINNIIARIGYDGGAGIVNMSGASTWSVLAVNPTGLTADDSFTVAGTGINVPAANAVDGSTGTLTLSGNSALVLETRFFIGAASAAGIGAVGQVTIKGNAVINHSVEYISIGRNGNGTGTMTVMENGQFNHSVGDLNVSDAATTTGILNLMDSGLINCTSVSGTFVGKRGNGTINQTGGVFNTTNLVSIGRSAGGIGVVNVSAGSFNQTNPASSLGLGLEGGNGTLTISGAGSVNVDGTAGVRIADRATAVGVVNLNGGTLTTFRIQPATSAVAGSSTLNFDGGLLRASGGANSNFISGLNTATVKAGGADIDSNGQTITIAQPLLAGIPNSGGLTKRGTGTLSLTGNNTYTGDTTINDGALALGAGTNLADASAVRINGATSQLILTDGVTDDVNALWIDGVMKESGTWGSDASLAINKDNVHFSGTGILSVSMGPVSSDYTTWATGFLPADVSNPSDDNDHDGLSNLQEYAYGLNPVSGSSVNPIVVQLNKNTGTFSYQRRASTGLVYRIYTSIDLVNWSPDITAGLGQVPGPVADNKQTVVVTLTGGVPMTETKLFVRVEAN